MYQRWGREVVSYFCLFRMLLSLRPITSLAKKFGLTGDDGVSDGETQSVGELALGGST